MIVHRQTSLRVRGGSRSEVSAMGDRRKCRTYAASPAEPGGLPVMLASSCMARSDRHTIRLPPGRRVTSVTSGTTAACFNAGRRPRKSLAQGAAHLQTRQGVCRAAYPLRTKPKWTRVSFSRRWPAWFASLSFLQRPESAGRSAPAQGSPAACARWSVSTPSGLISVSAETLEWNKNSSSEL